jgi:hypothetical protein
MKLSASVLSLNQGNEHLCGKNRANVPHETVEIAHRPDWRTMVDPSKPRSWVFGSACSPATLPSRRRRCDPLPWMIAENCAETNKSETIRSAAETVDRQAYL